MFSAEKKILSFFYNHDASAFLEIHRQSWPLSSLAPGFWAHASHTTPSHIPCEPRWLDAACPWCIRKCGSVAIMGPEAKPRRSPRGFLPRHVRRRKVKHKPSFNTGGTKLGRSRRPGKWPSSWEEKKLKVLLLSSGQVLSSLLSTEWVFFSCLLWWGVEIS